MRTVETVFQGASLASILLLMALGLAIVFGLMGETLQIDVRGHTRDSYAYGALAAAKFLVTQKAGVYSMADVLGL